MCASSQLAFKIPSSFSTVASSCSIQWALLASTQEGRIIVVTVTSQIHVHLISQASPDASSLASAVSNPSSILEFSSTVRFNWRRSSIENNLKIKC